MKLLTVAVILCVCVWNASGDVAHVKAKAKALGRLKGKHHKRGILSAVPPYKLGHDIPLVTHSFVKPLVVTYPPTATVAAVKVPLTNPLVPHYPVGVGQKVPVPHPHYGLRFPHTKFIAKPDHHYHHHHHHVSPKPVVPVAPLPPPAPIPVPQPTPVVHPISPPPPPVFLPTPIAPAPVHAHPVPLPPAPIFQAHPAPLVPPPAVHALPPNHLQLRPLLPAPAVPLTPAQAFSSPFGLNQVPYVIRPGGAIQTSVFATYPRYPLLNYQSPLIPSLPAGPVPSIQQFLVERPEPPQFHFIPQASAQGGIFEPTPNVAIEQTPTYEHPTNIVPPSVIPLNPPHELPQPTVHVHPTQAAFPQHEIPLHPTQAVIPQPAVQLQPTQPSVHLDHDGWSPVPSPPHDASGQIPEAHYPQQGHQFTQEQGTQVYEQHTEDQYHDFQQQLQHHIQQQIEQAQYEQHLHNQHQLNQGYGAPQQAGQGFGQPNDFFQQNQGFAPQHGENFPPQGQDFSQQGQDFAHHGQDFGLQGQDFQGQNFGQDFSQNDFNSAQPGQEYGVPQGLEGRSGDQGDQSEANQQQFHNHIPLGLQPPIDRPLDHFR